MTDIKEQGQELSKQDIKEIGMRYVKMLRQGKFNGIEFRYRFLLEIDPVRAEEYWCRVTGNCN